MPDGVTIPGGPSFAGAPQPPDVPCDPTGEAWRGPPGPAGPAGPQGTITGVANIQDFDGGVNNDDALRFRNALASGKKTVFVPPGTYTFKSRVVQPGPFFPDPPPCVLFAGLDNIKVIAHGATFLIDNALTSTLPPVPYDGAGAGHVGFMGDCHNISWHGGRFYGNTTSSGSRVNAGMWFYCVSGVLVEDTEWLGEWRNGPFNGVWMFDCTFRNNRAYGSGLCWDFAYVENLLLDGNLCEGGAGYASNVGSCCFKLFADPNTYFFNTAGQTYAQVTWLSTGAVRQLRTGKISNNVRLIANTFNKWTTAIALDGVDGVSICENTIRDGPFATAPNASGITIQTSAQTVAFGTVTRNVFIHDNDIYANGGPGVQIAPDATAGIGTIEIVSNRIYDNNCINAIAWLNNILEVANFRLVGNDFISRTGSTTQQHPYDVSALGAVPGGYVRQNIGVAPYDQIGAFASVVFAPLAFTDPFTGTPRFRLQPDGNFVFMSTDGAGADRVVMVLATHSVAPLIFSAPLQMSSTVGFNNTAPIAKPTVSGAKGSNAALASLMTALAAYGLVTDSTTA